MLLASFLKWWYGNGLKNHLARLGDGLLRTVDFFSVDLLAANLFQPFRMIDSAKLERGALEDKISNFLSRMVSRLIGAGIRSFVLVFGVLALILHLVWVVVLITAWLIAPTMPVASLILFVMGVAPLWLK